MQICFGNLAPEGIVFKVSSMKNPEFEGKAVCFEDPRDIVRAVEQRKITPGSVIVLRNMGPVAWDARSSDRHGCTRGTGAGREDRLHL
jgi:dihydroxy-acid dehydratase